MKSQQLYSYFKKSTGVSTDTRTLQPGNLFFALKGGNFNGNLMADHAIKLGASAVVVDEEIGLNGEHIIKVDDVLTSLQQLARYHRDHLDCVVIGITGTNGKTTSKELIYAVLSSQYPTLATKGNLNNHIGVPLTLLSLTEDHDFGIIEMGANHLGEIAELCLISDPNYGLITNVGRAHLEGFGSFENIITTKMGLYDHIIQNDGTIFMNSNNEDLPLSQNYKHVVHFGTKEDDQCQGILLGASPFVSLRITTTEGSCQVNSKLIGAYNLDNILAAVCIGSYFKVPLERIKKAIENYVPSNNRSEYRKTGKNELILDAYNANPSSMELALKNFSATELPNKLAIIGDMFELGNQAAQHHLEIIQLVETLQLDCIFIGEEYSKHQPNDERFFKNTAEAKEYFNSNTIEGRTILIKGSRGLQLEKLIECF